MLCVKVCLKAALSGMFMSKAHLSYQPQSHGEAATENVSVPGMGRDNTGIIFNVIKESCDNGYSLTC